MIFTASYFEPQNHRGELVPISRSIPRDVKCDRSHPLRQLLAPSQSLLDWWKEQDKGELAQSLYIDSYRAEIGSRIEEIRIYLDCLDPAVDETWLCWEKAGEFCHRNLALKLVEKFRPDCVGGRDIPVKAATPKRLTVGSKVTNAKGWNGEIRKIEDCSTCEDGVYYWVWFRERAESGDKLVAKTPVVGMTASQIWRKG